MAMVNMNNLLNGKDSRWLQLEVCREFQRNKCTRPDTECKFAHPPANVEVQNGRVTACYDSIKGRCNREKPPCKYFHPPQHLKDQLLINGRNHLALKNALMQQMGLTPGQSLMPGQVPTVATNPYLTGMPQVNNTYTPYFTPSPMMPALIGPADAVGMGNPLGVLPQTVAMPQKMARGDRLEVCREFQRGACKRGEMECRFAHPFETMQANEDGSVRVCMDAVKGRCNRDPCRYFHPPLHLQAHIKAAQSRASIAMESKSFGSFYYENFGFPGMISYKRPGGDKSGMPVYQPTTMTAYQQLMQLPQPFVPVSCEYAGTPPLPQSSNQSIASTQNSIQSQLSTSVAGVNGVLVDTGNSTPLAPSSSGNGGGGVSINVGKQMVLNHDGDNTRNSPELINPSPPQVNQLVTHVASSSSPMTSPMPSVTNLTAMGNMASLPNISSIASIASMHHANVNTVANYTMANMANFNVLNTMGMGSSLTAMDPATLAKEVAHKNYAKAIKLSQSSHSYGINPLTALSYTGVALNKQAISMNSTGAAAAAAAVSGNPNSRQMIPTGLAGIPGATLTPTMPAGLLHYSRPSNATQINPYSLIRQHPILASPYVQGSLSGVSTSSAIQQAANPYIHSPYTMIPGIPSMHNISSVSGVSSAVPGVPTANVATLAAQPHVAIPVSTSVIMQPYKKMKTT